MADGTLNRLHRGMVSPAAAGRPGNGGDPSVAMAQGRSRPAWAEIDLGAVAHNARVLAGLVAPAELCAVVKAHGYGHGGPPGARAALAGGAPRLAPAPGARGGGLR